LRCADQAPACGCAQAPPLNERPDKFQTHVIASTRASSQNMGRQWFGKDVEKSYKHHHQSGD